MHTWIIGALLWGASTVTLAQHSGEAEHAVTSSAFDLQPRIVSADRVRGRGSKRFKLLNMQADRMLAHASYDGAQIPHAMVLPMPEGVASLVPEKGTGGYYWLSASEENPYRILSVSSVTYFSNPGPAPRQMLTQPKSNLMVSPVRLPREHNHYRSGDTEQFRISHLGSPVADAEVWLITSGGTEALLTSNQDGIVSVRFPDDFPTPNGEYGRHANHGRLSNSFVLVSHLKTPAKTLVSAFNYNYQPGPFRQKSQGLALALLAAGMLLAVPLVRMRTKKTKKAV